MPPVLSGGIGNHCELLVCQQILIPACLDEVAAELVVEYLLGLIGLERCYDLLVGLQLVRILEVSGTRCDQVPVLLDVQLVILVDGVLSLKAEIQCVVAVTTAAVTSASVDGITLAFSSSMVILVL